MKELLIWYVSIGLFVAIIDSIAVRIWFPLREYLLIVLLWPMVVMVYLVCFLLREE